MDVHGVSGQGSITIIGNSPALTVSGGNVTIGPGVTLITATNSPTILVTGGSLTLRGAVVQESTSYAQAAILISGGTVDLGTNVSPGGNTFNVNGTGEFIQDTTSSPVPDIGNTLEVNGALLSAPFLSFTSIGSSATSSVLGQPVTFTASVRAVDPNDGTPTGSVEFVDTTSGIDLGTTTVTNGLATVTTSALAAGSHAIIADYEGDSNFAFSFAALTQTVEQEDATSTALTSAANPSVYGQQVTFTATVTGNPPTSSTPTGTVTFKDGSTTLGTGTLNASGVATFTTIAFQVGVGSGQSITAVYGGGPNFLSSTSSALSQTVDPDGTTTTVSSSARSASFGQTLTFTATLSADGPGSGVPTGTVTFYDGTVNAADQIGTGTLSTNASGVTAAAFSTHSLPVGADTITAVYGGDGNFLTSSASASAITINQSIFVLDPSAGGALNLSGNATINVPGEVIVDSSSSSALSASGNAQVKASAIDVTGKVQKSGDATFSPAPTTGAAVLPDPLAGLTAPTYSGTPISEALGGNSAAAINPGVYSQITVSGNAKLTLNPGIYVIAGGGFSVSGNAGVTGTGVMIDNTKSSTGTYGSITFSGNGSYNLSPPTSGTYAGIVIFQSRDNTKSLTISGNASGMTGTIYAPRPNLPKAAMPCSTRP